MRHDSFSQKYNDGSACVSEDRASLDREPQNVFLTLSREPTRVFRSLTTDTLPLVFISLPIAILWEKSVGDIRETRFR